MKGIHQPVHVPEITLQFHILTFFVNDNKLIRIAYISIFLFLVGWGLKMHFSDIDYVSNHYHKGYMNTDAGTYDIDASGTVFFNDRIAFLLAAFVLVFGLFFEWKGRD